MNELMNTLHRFRFLLIYLLACYGFWIVGLPFWIKCIMDLGGLESTLFFGVVIASPISVPGILLFYTFVAPRLHWEFGNTVLAVWGIFATSLVLSWAITRFILRKLTKAKGIQPRDEPDRLR